MPKKVRKSVRNQILDVVGDCVKDLMYYDRKEDEELGVGDIEAAIRNGTISFDEIVDQFRSELFDHLPEDIQDAVP